MNFSKIPSLRLWLPGLLLHGLSGITLSCAVGCSSFSLFNRGDALASDPFGAPSTDGASIDKVQGPLERTLFASSREKSGGNTAADAQGLRDYEVAMAYFDRKEYAKSEKAFKAIADEHQLDETGFFRKRKWKNVFSTRSELEANYYDNPLVEDSLFMLAESRYEQKKYPGAEDVYLQLLKQYPNTRHLDTSTKRLFDIALVWMQFKGTTNEEVQVASFSDSGPSSKPEIVKNKDYDRPGFFNVSDRQRPWTDTEGRALEALKAIWLNDPTGPLADDALMLTASHYLRVGRYAEAAETYRLLRQEFPDSPHVKDAYLLGAHVTQASYQGAAYDQKNLEEARKLKALAARMFTDMSPAEKERLQAEMAKLDDALMARDFEQALFWLNKGKFDAVEMSCHSIINRYPDSKYAGKARGLLKRLPEFRNQNTLVLAIRGISIDDIESIDEEAVAAGPGPLDALPPAREPRATAPNATPGSPTAPGPNGSAAPAQPPSPAPRYLPSLEMPKLKPIPVPRLWQEKEPELDSAPPFPGESSPTPDPGRVRLTLGDDTNTN